MIMDNTGDFNLRQARTFGGVLSSIFYFFRISFVNLMKNFFLILGPFIFLSSISFYKYMSYFFKFMKIGPGKNPDPFQDPQFFSSIFLYLVIVWISFLLLITMLQLIIFKNSQLYEELGKDSITVKAIWRGVRKDFLKVLGTMIGLGLIFLIGSLISIPFITMSAAYMGIYVPVYLLIFTYFMVTFSIVPAIRVYENTGFFRSVKRSMSLMYGFWWKTFGLYNIIGILILFLCWTPMILALMITGFTDMNYFNIMENNFFEYLIPVFSFLYFSIYLTIFSLIIISSNIQYLNIIEHKEGKSLLDKVDKLGEDSKN